MCFLCMLRSFCLDLLAFVMLGLAGKNASLPATGRGTFWGHTLECPDLAPVDILNVIQ